MRADSADWKIFHSIHNAIKVDPSFAKRGGVLDCVIDISPHPLSIIYEIICDIRRFRTANIRVSRGAIEERNSVKRSARIVRDCIIDNPHLERCDNPEPKLKLSNKLGAHLASTYYANRLLNQLTLQDVKEITTPGGKLLQNYLCPSIPPR